MKENLQCTSKYGHLRISQDICHVRMTDIEGFLTKYGHSDNLLNNNDRYVTFVTHDRSRSKNPTLVLKPAYCKTATFQASFFNRIVKPWNTICNLAPHDKFSSLSLFKYFLRATYFTLLDTTYDIDMPCTWFFFRNCPCHRS